MIFVSGVKTGNLASPIARREPLALLAAYNVMRRYNVDPDRVFISGYSGGSRVALRLALAYPDVFRGAFLDAGADPIGAPDLPLPPRPLFDRFRTTSKLVYFTGAADELHQDQEDSSLLSLKRWCVTNFATRSQMRLTHELAPPSALAAALTELNKPARTLTDKDALCWSRITAAVDDALARAEVALAHSDFKAAQSMVDDADRRFGGLTAPRIVELYRKLRRNAAAPGAQ
jgi:pimeloyl-ACP methyl ester carboxylesterase